MKNKKNIGIIIAIIVVIIIIICGVSIYNKKQNNKFNNEKEITKQITKSTVNKEPKDKSQTNQKDSMVSKNDMNKRYVNFDGLKQYIINESYQFFIDKYSSKISDKQALKEKIIDYINANVTETVVHENLALKGESFDKDQISVAYNKIEPAGTFVFKISNFVPGENGYLMVYRNFLVNK